MKEVNMASMIQSEVGESYGNNKWCYKQKPTYQEEGEATSTYTPTFILRN